MNTHIRKHLNNNELRTIIGGSWPGKDLIDGLYNAGYKVGQAIAKWVN